MSDAQSHNSKQQSGDQAEDKSSHLGLFDRFACRAAEYSGKAGTFILAAALVVGWGISGPFFGYSETWQLVINTSTTIVTFLMVFIIQHAQNRDTAAMQLKLSELIMAIQEADNKVADAEDMSEDDIKREKARLAKKNSRSALPYQRHAAHG